MSAESLTYTAGAPVQVFATHVGPMANAMETYPYYNLAWCPAASGSENSVAEGQGITADVHVATGYRFEFGKDVEQATACTVQLTPGDIDAFSRAIEEEWYGELTVDDLPMWFAVGEGEHEDFLLGHTDSSKHWLFTHLTFTLGVNGDRIVTANVSVSMAHRADITTHDPSHVDAHKAPGLAVHEASTAPLPVTFTYSVRFVPSDVAYESRQDVYAHSAFMPAALEIHWLSIVNSVVLVMLLTIFLGIILLRVVRNDFTRMLQEADEEVGASMTEETGWKLLHADVFRPPKHANLFAACVGTGIHLFVTALCLLAFGVLGVFSLSRRGSVVMYTIVMYVLTCFLSGYFSARVFKQLRGTNWVWNVVLSIFVFPAPLTACFAVANTTALAKNSTAALPATTILALIATFLFIVMPLTIAGGITGHNVKDVEPVCRVAKVPRQVPERSVLGSLPVQLFIAGFLPFSAISIEMHYILSSIWGHQVRKHHAHSLVSRVRACACVCVFRARSACGSLSPCAGVHSVRRVRDCVWPTDARDCLCDGVVDLLPAGGRGPSLVVALLPVRRCSGCVHLLALRVLLLRALCHERVPPVGVLLFVHGQHRVRLLPHVRCDRLLFVAPFRQVHLRVRACVHGSLRVRRFFCAPCSSASPNARVPRLISRALPIRVPGHALCSFVKTD
ncbi:transmembrane 9 family protein [archaeon]|nr:MAG: transmembrane 9 family protein [archaeon]